MFFSSSERIAAVRRMIAAEELDVGGAAEALATLKEFQREDFEGIFTAMDGLPVTIRMLVSGVCVVMVVVVGTAWDAGIAEMKRSRAAVLLWQRHFACLPACLSRYVLRQHCLSSIEAPSLGMSACFQRARCALPRAHAPARWLLSAC